MRTKSRTAIKREESRTILSLRTFLSLLLLLMFLACSARSPLPSSEQRESDVIDREQILLSNIRQQTFVGRRAGEGYFDNSGKLFVFQSERDSKNPFYQIYLRSLESGKVELVSTGEGKTTCAWIHPDQTHVLFASTHLDPRSRELQEEELEFRKSHKQKRYSWDYDASYDLFSRNRSNSEIKQLTFAKGYDAEAAYSPDGSQIVFASNRAAYARALSEKEQETLKQNPSYFIDLYIMNSDGSGLKQLTTTPGYDGGPFFSSDGKKITWRRFSKDGGTAEIYVMNRDGSEQKQISRLGKMSWAPFFHPSGDYLIFSTNVHGFKNFELYILGLDGKTARVTHKEGFDGLPVFSPDGSILSWTSTRADGKHSQLFFAEWNDEQARKMLGLAAKSESSEAKKDAAPTESELRSRIKKHVKTLSNSKFGGRKSGTEGELKATEYAARELAALGLVPAGDDNSYYEYFDFTSGVSLGTDNHLALSRIGSEIHTEAELHSDWRPLAFSQSGRINSAPIVFVGYGLVAPKSTSPSGETLPGYDSYGSVDVTDKWVLAFRNAPKAASEEERRHLSRYSGLRFKAMAARDRKAKGLIVVSSPIDSADEELVALHSDATLSGTSLPSISISRSFAAQLVADTERDFNSIAESLEKGEILEAFELNKVSLSGEIEVLQEKARGRNVLAMLPATRQNPQTKTLVIGAHIDHLGKGIHGSSRASKDEQGHIHPGADDNASGVALALEIARSFSKAKAEGTLVTQHNLLIGLWSAEEMGLIGSTHFTNSRAKKTTDGKLSIFDDYGAYINMDMVGRLRKSLVIHGGGSSPSWAELIESAAPTSNVSIRLESDAYLPTDATSFYLKGVPILSAFTGVHKDYHAPSDTYEKLNYRGLEDIHELLTGISEDLLTAKELPEFREVKKPKHYGERVSLRAYLGTVPEYGESGVVGVKLSGVAKDGPADKAGLRGGDTIVKLADKTIENVYDYTYAIEGLKIDESVQITVLRDGAELTLSITPGARK
jgi:Tol biopolymer transport system component